MGNTIRELMHDLTGQESPFDADPNEEVSTLLAGSGIGYSQMNEILLVLGYDRISFSFFQYLVDGTAEYVSGSAITSREKLRAGIDRFRKLAALRYGSVRIAFRYLSNPDFGGLAAETQFLNEIPDQIYTSRHDPLLPVTEIPGDKTYYLGYIVEREIREKLRRDPDDENAKRELQLREEIVALGRRNHEAYLACDHMDVYVATSMRERHEYQIVNQVISQVFSNPELQKLKIRWFDPTQAYCLDRIDKGLAEGLMLKRAKCTLYLAQESDTLGKDSELASTLAQGKPVIAYVPTVRAGQESRFVDDLLALIKKGRPGLSDVEIILDQLRVFAPDAAWKDPEIIKWIADQTAVDMTAARKKLGETIRVHYDKRASTLKDSHPLGIQVNLDTGVANGVLVARSLPECSDLIRRVLTNKLEFRLEAKEISGRPYVTLVETITGSVFRVVSGDSLLTNVFWNYYLRN